MQYHQKRNKRPDILTRPVICDTVRIKCRPDLIKVLMAKTSARNIALPSSILLILLLLLSLLIACVLAPVIDLVIDKLFSMRYDTHGTLAHSTFVILFILCIIFRNSLKSDVRGSLNLPFYTVISHFLIGIAVAILLIGVAVGIVALFRIRGVDFGLKSALLRLILLALWVGVFEEILYRGFILQSLSSEIRAFPAIIISSAFYSLIHFTYPQSIQAASAHSFDFLSGFKSLPHLLDRISDYSAILPDATGYFLLGVLLSLAYIKMGSLYVPMGLHAFLVFIEQSRLVVISRKFLGGRKIIFGSHGPILETFLGSIMCWILLLIAIIGFLSIGGLSSGTSRKSKGT